MKRYHRYTITVASLICARRYWFLLLQLYSGTTENESRSSKNCIRLRKVSSFIALLLSKKQSFIVSFPCFYTYLENLIPRKQRFEKIHSSHVFRISSKSTCSQKLRSEWFKHLNMFSLKRYEYYSSGVAFRDLQSGPGSGKEWFFRSLAVLWID